MLLYLGDTHLLDAARYLAGLIHAWGWEFDYVRSDETPSPELLAVPRKLFVLSDYPAARFPGELQRELLAQVERGAGLVMIGGWESFHGLGGDWDGTPIGDALPVEIASSDDRVNADRPVLVAQAMEHPAVTGLPWSLRPPVIGGYNRFRAKPQAMTLLEARTFDARRQGPEFVFTETERSPLLVVGDYGKGRAAALATDVAPHWVGPLVDWGSPRVTACAPGSEAVEVGCHYAAFLRQLLAWAGNAPSP